MLTTSGHQGRSYELSGDTAWNYDEFAATAQELLGTPVRYEALTPEQENDQLRAAGLDEATAGSSSRSTPTSATAPSPPSQETSPASSATPPNHSKPRCGPGSDPRRRNSMTAVRPQPVGTIGAGKSGARRRRRHEPDRQAPLEIRDHRPPIQHRPLRRSSADLPPRQELQRPAARCGRRTYWSRPGSDEFESEPVGDVVTLLCAGLHTAGKHGVTGDAVGELSQEREGRPAM